MDGLLEFWDDWIGLERLKHLIGERKKKKALNMVLVPANMSRLSFGPCKKKICFLVSAKKFCFLK